MLPRILSREADLATAHHLYSLEFKERGVALWAFMRTWEKDIFRRVAVASPLMQHTSCPCSGWSWLLWVVRHPSLQFLVGRICWPTLTASIWEFGKWEQPQDSRVPSLRSASPETMPAKGVLFRFGSLLDNGTYCHALKGADNRDWRCHAPVFVMPSSQESCRCRRWFRSSATSWVCGLSLWSTLRRLVERPMGTA